MFLHNGAAQSGSTTVQAPFDSEAACRTAGETLSKASYAAAASSWAPKVTTWGCFKTR